MRLLLFLLSSLLIATFASATALPSHPSLPALLPAPATTLESQIEKRSRISLPQLIPGYPSARITRLPPNLYGFFTDLSSLRPSLPVSKIYIHFFRIAVRIAAADRVPERTIQRIEYGILVFEMWSEIKGGMVSREMVEVVSLWLGEQCVRGWTGYFVAKVWDSVTGEAWGVRLVTPLDLLQKANSPWD